MLIRSASGGVRQCSWRAGWEKRTHQGGGNGMRIFVLVPAYRKKGPTPAGLSGYRRSGRAAGFPYPLAVLNYSRPRRRAGGRSPDDAISPPFKGDPMTGFWLKLFDSQGFVPRSQCGGAWDEGLILLHNASDAAIWLAYLAIPLVLVYLVRRRKDLPFHWMFLLFGLFIVSCGFTPLVQVVSCYGPLYRLAGLVKAVTAVASLAAVINLAPVAQQAFGPGGPQELEREGGRKAAWRRSCARRRPATARSWSKSLRSRSWRRWTRGEANCTSARRSRRWRATRSRNGETTPSSGTSAFTPTTGRRAKSASPRPSPPAIRIRPNCAAGATAGWSGSTPPSSSSRTTTPRPASCKASPSTLPSAN